MRLERAFAVPLAAPLAAANAADLGRTLKDALKTAGVAPAPVLASVGRDRVVLKDLKIPPVPDAEEANVVRFQAAKEMTEAADAVVIDYLPFARAEADGQKRVITVGLRKDAIAVLKTLCEAAGLKLAGVTPRPVGLYAALQRAIASGSVTPPEAKQGSAAILARAGNKWGELVIARDGHVAFSRGLAAGSLSSEAMLVGELRRNLTAYSSQSAQQPVDALYVVEEDNPAGGWSGRVQSGLPVAVQRFDPLAGLADAPSEARGGFAGPVGLLHLKATAAAPPIDFLSPREPKPVVDPAKRKMVMFGLLFAALVVGGLGLLYVRLDGMNRKFAALSAEKLELDNRLAQFEEDAKRMAALKDWRSRGVNVLDELFDDAERNPNPKATQLAYWKVNPRNPEKNAKVRYVAKKEMRFETDNEKDVDRFQMEMVKDQEYHVDPKEPKGFAYGPGGRGVGAAKRVFELCADVEQRAPQGVRPGHQGLAAAQGLREPEGRGAAEEGRAAQEGRAEARRREAGRGQEAGRRQARRRQAGGRQEARRPEGGRAEARKADPAAGLHRPRRPSGRAEMTAREKRMSFVLMGGLLLFVGGFFGYQFLHAPYQAKAKQAAELADEIQKREDRVAEIEKDRKAYEAARLASLPADEALARREYGRLLESLLARSDFPKGSFTIIAQKPRAGTVPGTTSTAATAKKKPPLTEHNYVIKATGGTLVNLVEFLELLYKEPLLHQVRKIEVKKGNSQKRPGELEIDLTVTAVVLENAEKRQTLIGLPPPAALVAGGAAAFALATSSVDSGRESPVPMRNVLAEPARDYRRLLARNPFYGPPPPPDLKKPPTVVVKKEEPKPPAAKEYDIAPFVLFTASTADGDGNLTLELDDTLNRKMYRIAQPVGGKPTLQSFKLGFFDDDGKEVDKKRARRFMVSEGEAGPAVLAIGTKSKGTHRSWRVKRATWHGIVLEKIDEAREKAAPGLLALAAGPLAGDLFPGECVRVVKHKTLADAEPLTAAQARAELALPAVSAQLTADIDDEGKR